MLRRMNFMVEYVRPRRGPCFIGCEVAERVTKSWAVNLSRLKGFHLRFAQKMRSGRPATGEMTYCQFHSDQNIPTIIIVHFSYVERANKICLLCTKVITSKDFKQKLTISGGQKRPKLVWILNWSPERRYISSGTAKVHFWQTFCAEIVQTKTKP